MTTSLGLSPDQLEIRGAEHTARETRSKRGGGTGS
jgi:hypothetical protein